MSAVSRHPITVPATALDGNGHVNNVVYLQWMQDAALRHARALGGMDAAQAAAGAWVVRSHHVEYLRPAFAGDRIEVQTWVAELGRASSLRRYRFLRVSDGAVLVRGETRWAFVDAQTGRPREIPERLRALYPVVPDGQAPDAGALK